MLDTKLRPLVDPLLEWLARGIAATSVSANALSMAGALAGALAGAAVAAGRFGIALVLLVVSRLLDGLDGAVARQHGITPFGGYLDAVCDYVFYAAVPLGFALARPEWAVPAAALLASFLLSGASFLAFAAVAAQRRFAAPAQQRKGFYYLAGLAEGTETIAVFVVALLRPAWFPLLAYGFASLCVLTAIGRLLAARHLLR